MTRVLMSLLATLGLPAAFLLHAGGTPAVGLQASGEHDAPARNHSAAGMPRKHPFDPHRFAMDGEVWFPLGFYGGSMAMTSNDGAFEHPMSNSRAENAFNFFLDTLDSTGLNYYRAWINWGASRHGSDKRPSDWDYHMVHPYLRSTTECCASDGGNRFDLDRFNPEYFAMIRRLVASSGAKGLVAQIALFDCWHVHNPRGTTEPGPSDRLVSNIEHDYYSYRLAGSQVRPNNVNGAQALDGDDWTRGGTAVPTPGEPAHVAYQRKFIHKVIETLPAAEFPNVIWETCNENRDDPSFHDFVYRVVRAQGDPRLVMPIDLPEHREVAGHRTPAPSGAESIEAMHDRLAGVQFDWDEPLITDNDCCSEPPGIDAAFRRKKAWAALTAGAHTDYFINNMPAHEHLMTDPDILKSMGQFSHILDLMHARKPNLLGGVPSDAKVSGGNWAFGRPGEEYLAYLPQGGSITVQDLPARFQAMWIDPRTNDRTVESGTGPTAVLTAPGSGDWALHIRCGAGSHQDVLDEMPVLPQRIEAEDFDCGGQGVAYQDSDRGNNNNPFGGTTYRFGDVDLQATGDVGGGYNVGWMGAGEWLEHTFQVSSAGVYQPSFRVAGTGVGNSIRFRIELDGEPVGGVISTTPTAGPQVWKTVAGPEIPVGLGTHTMRFVVVTGNFNLNWIDFAATGGQPLSVPCNADTTVVQEYPDNNYGDFLRLRIRDGITGQARRTFLRFQVPSIPGTLLSAKLRIKVRARPIADADLYRMNDMQWTEGGLTWSNHLAPPTTFTFVSTAQNLAPDTYHEIDVTDAVGGPGPVTIGIASSADLGGRDFYSRESAYQPTLEITYLP